MNKQATVSNGGERRTFPAAWRWQVLSQVSASLEQDIPKVPVRSSSLSLQVPPSTGKTGNALPPSQGDAQHAWGLLTKLRRFKSVKTTTEKEEGSDSISGVGGKGPIQPQHTLLPKLLSTPTGAMLDSKQKSDSEYSPLSENIFPISSFTAHLLCLWGGFFPSSLSCNFGSFFYFSWMVQSAEVAFFSCLQNSLKYCRAGANRSRGVTTTSRMREIHIFSISLKKQQISVLWLSIKGARAPGSHRELHKLNTELSVRKNNQPQCPQQHHVPWKSHSNSTLVQT